MSSKNQAYANAQLNKLKDFDAQTSAAYYDMGQILSAFSHGMLYETLDYESFSQLVEEELSFGAGTAHKYANTYKHFKRLHYNKVESLELIRNHSFTRLAAVLPSINTKIGTRAVKMRIEQLGTHQINFTLNDAEFDAVKVALGKHGAIEAENGRMMHSTEAFMDILGVSKTVKKAA